MKTEVMFTKSEMNKERNVFFKIFLLTFNIIIPLIEVSLKLLF